MNKRFYEKSNITDVNNPVNITYGELLKKSPNEVDVWIDELRDYVITQWDDNHQPPVIGQNEEDIIRKWSKLHEVNVNEFFDKKTGVIRNFNKLASGVNQFFPTMLKTKISTGVSSDNAHSIYDMFSEDDYRDNIGSKVKISLKKMQDNTKNISGTIIEVIDKYVFIKSRNKSYKIEFENIKKANLDIEIEIKK